MAARRWWDGERYWEMQPLSVVRAVAPYRRGPQARLRATTRCLLLQMMGYDCSRVPLDASIDGLRSLVVGPSYAERGSMTLVAEDALRELGYDAAADAVNEAWGAKAALILLEAGPPSVMIGERFPIFKHTIRHLRGQGSFENLYLVGRRADDPKWWYRFAVGKAVHDRAGNWIGWDREDGHTFQRRGRSLADVKAGSYGSEPLA